MASRNYSLLTIKTLFGEASTCAYPGCDETLILTDRGAKTVIAEIAHIRSEQSNGPRYDSTYTGDIDGPENLLLLCGKHHKPVDRHESKYPVAELLTWKGIQAAAAARDGGTPISTEEAKQFSGPSEQAVATMADLARMATRVERACRAARDRLNAVEAEKRRATQAAQRASGPIYQVHDDGTRTNISDRLQLSRHELNGWQRKADEAMKASSPAIQEALTHLDEEASVLRMMDLRLGFAANRVVLAAEAAAQLIGLEEAMDQSIDNLRVAVRDLWLQAHPES